jgi:23S rRNA (cytidine1920-2'-O)/16S rRNA (cytidine1409-2'-O)-methyltransferase
MTDQLRLDILLTERGFAPSRSKAQEMIKSGIVFVDGTPAVKPSAIFPNDVSIDLQGEFCPFVSRGGLKLQKALREFSVDPEGLVCSDCGASTGGFTDCLLQLGAKKVFAIDVGTDQLVPSIRNDARVVAMEQTNIRYVTTDMLGEKLDLSVVDVSFISLRLVLPAIRDLLKENGQIVCLIKPQFEAGKASVGKKGVVKDMATHILV